MAIMDLVNSFMNSVRLDVDDDSKSKKGTKSNSGSQKPIKVVRKNGDSSGSQKPIKVVRKNGDSDDLDILSDETRDALLEYVNHRDSGIDLENLILKGEFSQKLASLLTFAFANNPDLINQFQDAAKVTKDIEVVDGFILTHGDDVYCFLTEKELNSAASERMLASKGTSITMKVEEGLIAVETGKDGKKTLRLPTNSERAKYYKSLDDATN